MTQSFAADGHASNIINAMREGLAGPLAEGARTEALQISGSAKAVLEAGIRAPLLMVAPAIDLLDHNWKVLVTWPDATVQTVRFDSYTELGASLPLKPPALSPEKILANDIEVSLELFVDGQKQTNATLRQLVKLQVLSGFFGRLMYIMKAETPRIRRSMRQIEKARYISTARGQMLDRIGQELAIPRFADMISEKNGDIVTKEKHEDDEAYRQRLSLYRKFMMPTRKGISTMLNTSHAAKGSAGNAPFSILEEDNNFSIALRLVSVAATNQIAEKNRNSYLAYLRDTTLINPLVNVPTKRKLPSSRRRLENALRKRLRDRLDFSSSDSSMSPMLAQAFGRLDIVLSSLNLDDKVKVFKAQSDNGGSRFELGLMAKIRPFSKSLLAKIANRLEDVNLDNIRDSTAKSILSRLLDDQTVGTDSADWLWKSCGMRTIHQASANRQVLSHFTTGGLNISGGSDLTLTEGRTARFLAQDLASNDQPINSVLHDAFGQLDSTNGHPKWNVIPPSQLDDMISQISPAPALLQQSDEFGPTADFDKESFRKSLGQYPKSMFSLCMFDQGFSASLVAGNPQNWQIFRTEYIERLAQSGIAGALLVMADNGRLILISSTIALPVIGANLRGRRSAGFVWRALPVTGDIPRVSGRGTQAMLTSEAGLSAIAVISYARKGLTDPFEYRVEAAPNHLMDLRQYEFLMNILRHVTPAGVQANTWNLRRNNIDLNGDGEPTPLPVNMNRAFRPFHRRRFVG